MSETSDSDDGEFDKEAEREKLREKYADEEESREATQHMSDLLLKGATMTSSHCDQCGDPIFRYEDQEFCPTCGEPVDEDGESAESEATMPAEAGESGGDPAAATDPDDHGRPADDGATSQASEPTADGKQSTGEASETATRGQAGGAPQAAERSSERSVAERGASGGEPTRESRTDDASDRAPVAAEASGRSLDEARGSLVRTLDDLTRRAESAEDVRRTRDLLDAAREAAEAIAAVDRANR